MLCRYSRGNLSGGAGCGSEEVAGPCRCCSGRLEALVDQPHCGNQDHRDGHYLGSPLIGLDDICPSPGGCAGRLRRVTAGGSGAGSSVVT